MLRVATGPLPGCPQGVTSWVCSRRHPTKRNRLDRHDWRALAYAVSGGTMLLAALFVLEHFHGRHGR